MFLSNFNFISSLSNPLRGYAEKCFSASTNDDKDGITTSQQQQRLDEFEISVRSHLLELIEQLLSFQSTGNNNEDDAALTTLLKYLKEKNFKEVRKWVVNNLDNDASVLLRRIYDSLYESLVPGSIPAAVLVIAKYQYQVAFVADQEINMLACLTELMVECEFR